MQLFKVKRGGVTIFSQLCWMCFLLHSAFVCMLYQKMFHALMLLFLFFVSCASATELEQQSDLQPFIKWLLEDSVRLEDVRFSEVVEAVSGKKILPLQLDQSPDAEMAQEIRRAVDYMLVAFEGAGHPIHEVGRINEVSGHVEDFLRTELNKAEGLVCALPSNASGEFQRSGYPDLRLLHLATGRVCYIDPKVYKQGSERSSFRSFYFEPKRETNKILDDASHLILGIGHGGKVDGRWIFESWQLVDLVDFRVRLKAEFQASNRDLYRDDAVKLRSRAE